MCTMPCAAQDQSAKTSKFSIGISTVGYRDAIVDDAPYSPKGLPHFGLMPGASVRYHIGSLLLRTGARFHAMSLSPSDFTESSEPKSFTELSQHLRINLGAEKQFLQTKQLRPLLAVDGVFNYTCGSLEAIYNNGGVHSYSFYQVPALGASFAAGLAYYINAHWSVQTEARLQNYVSGGTVKIYDWKVAPHPMTQQAYNKRVMLEPFSFAVYYKL
jgi:hypothetical protein